MGQVIAAKPGFLPIPLRDRHQKSVFTCKEMLDKNPPTKHIVPRSAEVAELVDALGSGSSWGSPVEVRVFSSAPLKNQGFIP